VGDLSRITACDILTFLEQVVAGKRPVRQKSFATHLRNFCRYLFTTGTIRTNLALSLPSVVHRYGARAPRHVTTEQVALLLQAVQADTTAGRRNYAMVLLLARLGLRAQEVVRIQLEDIDWRSGEISIRGKGERQDRLPLPSDVGEAVADYSRFDRTSTSRTLFVTRRHPHTAFKDGAVLNAILKDAFARAGGDAADPVCGIAHSAAQPGGAPRPARRFVGRNRRYVASSLSCVHHDLCSTRHRRPARDRATVARRGRCTMSTLSGDLDRYLTLRRSLGYDLRTSERILRTFLAFAEQQQSASITTDLFVRWQEAFGHPNRQTWAGRLGIVRLFAQWLQSQDERHEVPPQVLMSRRTRRSRPYIYTDDEIQRIVAAAAALPSHNGIRAHTYATFFGLLAVTGLRVSEAVALDVVDVDLATALLTVRRGKLGKSRLLPVAQSTALRLARYAEERDRQLGASPAAFFVSDRGTRITDCSARYTFAVVCRSMGLRAATKYHRHGCGPRIHDLRHTFAVRTLVQWYRTGKDPAQEMLQLTTYLGHKDPAHTYWYIEAVPELLDLASQRTERLVAP
jgi:integrase/recombinase XerD